MPGRSSHAIAGPSAPPAERGGASPAGAPPPPAPAPVDPARERLRDLVLGTLLATSVLGAARVPGLDAGLPAVVMPAAGLALAALGREHLAATVSRHRRLLAAAAAILLWSALAAMASEDRGTGFRQVGKAASALLVFLGLLAGFEPRRAPEGGTPALPARPLPPWTPRALRITLGFLVALALGGVAEAIVPEGFLYRLLRSERSLVILPRIASVLSSPNGFGVLMVVGVALSERLATAAGADRRARRAFAVSALLVTQVAQSGSRNAWAVLVLVLLATLRLRWGQREGRRALGLAGIFAASMLLLPVPAFQLAFADRSPVARWLLPERYLYASSLEQRFESAGERLLLWGAAADEVSRHPVLGLGPGVFTRHVAPSVLGKPGVNAHDLALDLAVDIGLPGLALAIGVLLLLRPWTWADRVAGPALAALLAAQIVDCFLYEPAAVLLMLILAAALAAPEAGALDVPASQPGAPGVTSPAVRSPGVA